MQAQPADFVEAVMRRLLERAESRRQGQPGGGGEGQAVSRPGPMRATPQRVRRSR